MAQIACCAPFPPARHRVTLFGFKQEDLNVMLAGLAIFMHLCIHAYNSVTQSKRLKR